MSLSTLNSERTDSRPHSYPNSQDIAEQGLDRGLEMNSMAGPSSNDETTKIPRQSDISLWWHILTRPINLIKSIFPVKQTPRESIYQAEYNLLEYPSYSDMPKGYSRVASFLESCDSFSIYRGFAPLHARVLLSRTSKIAAMYKELQTLDREIEQNDLQGTPQTGDLETKRQTLLENSYRELLDYDALLIQFQKLKSFSPTPEKDHLSVYRWLCREELAHLDQYEWMRQPEDFISLVTPKSNRLERFVQDNLNTWPICWFQKYLLVTPKRKIPTEKTVKLFSNVRISLFSKILVVCMSVLILLIPVILFLAIMMKPGWMAFTILAFVFLFSIIVTLLTDAGTQEIFFGTSAYCAVLVVFLGNLKGAA